MPAYNWLRKGKVPAKTVELVVTATTPLGLNLTHTRRRYRVDDGYYGRSKNGA